MCFEWLTTPFVRSNEKTCENRSVRVFAVSPINPTIPSDMILYKIQSKNDKNSKVTIKELHNYIQSHYSMEMASRMLIIKNNIQISKMIQNLYVTSLGGITQKSMKIYRIRLMVNATHDLPNIDDASIEVLRVPMNSNIPDAVELLLDDVADKIQASSFKNFSTLIYCYDGMIHSLVLVACYFIKYTDLSLYEIMQHLVFSRKGYNSEYAFGSYGDVIIRYATKYKKIYCDGDSQDLINLKTLQKPIMSIESAYNKTSNADIEELQKNYKFQIKEEYNNQSVTNDEIMKNFKTEKKIQDFQNKKEKTKKSSKPIKDNKTKKNSLLKNADNSTNKTKDENDNTKIDSKIETPTNSTNEALSKSSNLDDSAPAAAASISKAILSVDDSTESQNIQNTQNVKTKSYNEAISKKPLQKNKCSKKKISTVIENNIKKVEKEQEKKCKEMNKLIKKSIKKVDYEKRKLDKDKKFKSNRDKVDLSKKNKKKKNIK